MTAAEAHAAAAAEGLALLRAENDTGFWGVYPSRTPQPYSSTPFQARVWHDRRTNHLGNFATAEEAALAVARFLGLEGVAAARAADAPPRAPPRAPSPRR